MNEVKLSGEFVNSIAVATDEYPTVKFRLYVEDTCSVVVVVPKDVEMPRLEPHDRVVVAGSLETTLNTTYINATSVTLVAGTGEVKLPPVASAPPGDITGPLDLTKVVQANEEGHRLIWKQIDKLKGKIGRIDYDHVAGCIENMRERLETLERNGEEQHKTAERLLGCTDMLIERADKAANNIESLWERLGLWIVTVAKTMTAVENAQAHADHAHDRIVTVEKRQDQVVEQQDILRSRSATLEVNVVDHEKTIGQLLDDHKALTKRVDAEIGALELLHDRLKAMSDNFTHMGRIFMSEIMAKSDD